MPHSGRKTRKKPKVPFPHKLILNQWILSLFYVKNFDEIASRFHRNDREGLDENNVHYFHHDLTEAFPDLVQLPKNLLLEYDNNIFKHTKRLNERRINRQEPPIVWKYFQYLTLLFCEIYLDRYFSNPEALLQELNKQIDIYNRGRPGADKIESFDEAEESWPQLNKLSFWMATGSGKTLLMHVNLLQYLSALHRHRRQRELNRILLLTPNEGLSYQHLKEFTASGIDAKLFDKNEGGLYRDQTVEIIEVTRLKDKMGDKTVAVEAFEGNNLVLVDEGHRGASAGAGGTWMGYRNALCERGFSFEYSATFGQAIKGNPDLINLYSKSILCDYSYRYFYADGYGKDYQILNLDTGTQQNHLELYLVACLLSFFQQQRLYHQQWRDFRPFKIENPLWIFVGGRVTASLSKKDASDIVEILKFLARYVSDRSGSIQRINTVLNKGLITSASKNLFSQRFQYLNALEISPSKIYDETLQSVFNASNGGQLHIENLKGIPGEVSLRVGSENDAFGVINVGDDKKLVKICGEQGFTTGEREFVKSLFHELNEPSSKVNILIGSKKFTEGWNSWRVSTMGLMNVGRGEGAQIIQLFGRGVRLKGYDMSLQRSSSLSERVLRPENIGILETLGIFGIHADYMAQFRDFLVEEGLPVNEDRVEFILPVIRNLGKQKLKTIQIKKEINGVPTEFGDAFRKLGPIPTVSPPDSDTEYLQKNRIRLNWYPKIQAMRSEHFIGEDAEASPNITHLQPNQVAFFDYDFLYFELERFRLERGWYNLNFPYSAIKALLADQSWYYLLIPPEEMEGDSYEKVHLWQEIALALLKKYTERYYTFRKHQWELPHLEYSVLTSDDPNLLGADESSDDDDGYYRIMIDQSKDDIISKLEELKTAIKRGEVKEWSIHGIEAIWFGNHLFQPLLSMDSNVVEITPTPLNKGERQFVEDLRSFCRRTPEFFKNRDLYLLRNLSRGRGVGFFEAGNFYPDFILWLVDKDIQYVMFVDPKGIRYLGPSDPKIQFSKKIKEIEQRLGDTDISLHSFIVSNTSSVEMHKLWGKEKEEMENLNILFQEEDKYNYIKKMLSRLPGITQI